MVLIKIVKSKNFCKKNMLDKWLIALTYFYFKEESPGFAKTQCQLTTGGGNPRDSATENKPPYQGKGEKVW